MPSARAKAQHDEQPKSFDADKRRSPFWTYTTSRRKVTRDHKGSAPNIRHGSASSEHNPSEALIFRDFSEYNSSIDASDDILGPLHQALTDPNPPAEALQQLRDLELGDLIPFSDDCLVGLGLESDRPAHEPENKRISRGDERELCSCSAPKSSIVNGIPSAMSWRSRSWTHEQLHHHCDRDASKSSGKSDGRAGTNKSQGSDERHDR
ncbi:MAG: hypothetical protein Q9227_005203 [Pyrenula ochraceoflavens]